MKLDEEGLINAVKASAGVCREERATLTPTAFVKTTKLESIGTQAP